MVVTKKEWYQHATVSSQTSDFVVTGSSNIGRLELSNLTFYDATSPSIEMTGQKPWQKSMDRVLYGRRELWEKLAEL